MDPGYGQQNNQENGQVPYRPTVIVGEQNPEKSRSSNLAVTSLVLGILSIVFCVIFYVSFIVALVSLIMGIMSLAQHRDGHGLAVGGVITSAVGLLLSLVIGFLFILGTVMFL